jgi:hypothetical protein
LDLGVDLAYAGFVQLDHALRMTPAITEWCVGPAPFRQAQGPEHVEGLVAGPIFRWRTVCRRAATLHPTALTRLSRLYSMNLAFTRGHDVVR